MLSSTGALQSPAASSGHTSRFTAHHPWAVPCQQAFRQPKHVFTSAIGSSQLHHGLAQHSCTSVVVSSGASETSSSASIGCCKQTELLHTHTSPLLSWQAAGQQPKQQQQHAVFTGSKHTSSTGDTLIHYQHVQQHTALQASTTNFIGAKAAAAAAAAAPSAAVNSSAFSVLQLEHEDQLSAAIVSCADVPQLLQCSSAVATTGRKHHAAQLTVMASLLAASNATTATAAGTATCGHDTVADPSSCCHVVSDNVITADADAAAVARQLALQVVQVLTQANMQCPKPPLAVLHSRHLLETLLALQQLVRCTLNTEQQLQVQQKLRVIAEHLGRPEKLADIHACTDVYQLAAVVHWLQDSMGVVHIKAALVQLARMHGSTACGSSGRSSCSRSNNVAARDLADELLQLLFNKQQQYEQQQQQQQQQPRPFQVQPQYAASILWSLGQLLPLGMKQYSEQLGQQLLHASLIGVGQLNPRVVAMALHGAAKLDLQLPEQQQQVSQLQGQRQQQQQAPRQQQQQQEAALVQQLLDHTQQQLQYCDPQALTGLLWGLAQLQQQPGSSWLQQFYSSSWRMLSPDRELSSSSSSSSSSGSISSGRKERGSGSSSTVSSSRATAVRQLNGSSKASNKDGRYQPSAAAAAAAAAGMRDSASALNALELAAVLSSLVRLEQQPPAEWLTAASLSCHRQVLQFGQQELAVVLWAFAKLQRRPSEEFLRAASGRVQQQLTGFSAQNLALLLYAATRLDLQPQDALLQQMCQQLLQARRMQQWPETLEDALQQVQGEDITAASSSSSSVSSKDSVLQLSAEVKQQAGEQLQQANAQDLSLLAWSLGKQSEQQQQREQSVQLLNVAWLQSNLLAATQQLQQGSFTSQGMSMLLWGLGTMMHAIQQHSGGSSSSTRHPVAPAVAAGFWAALEAQSAQQLGTFTGHELANLLWGAGLLFKTTGQSPSKEWTDLLACQCLDLLDQFSGYQLGAVLQGLAWLQHPRGLNVLQAALSDGRGSRMWRAQPLELLLLLRCCVKYQHTPEHTAHAVLIAAVRQRAQQLTPEQVCQVLYLLGKMQQQCSVRQRQLAAAAAAAVRGASPRSSLDEGMHGRGSSSLGWRNAQRWQQQHQQSELMTQQQQQQLVPAGIVCELVQHLTGNLHQCCATHVTLMLWGVSCLACGGVPAEAVQSSSNQSQNADASSSSSGSINEGRHARTSGPLLFADCPSGKQLLQELYAHSSTRMQQFKPNELATLLYCVQRLGPVSPPAAWLDAVVQHLHGQLETLDGQNIAALAVALAGFNYVPSNSWLAAFVGAAVAAEKAGKLSTEWQRASLTNGLSALDPVAGQSWLQQTSVGGKAAAAAAVAAAAAAAATAAGDATIENSSLMVNGRVVSAGALQEQEAVSTLQ